MNRSDNLAMVHAAIEPFDVVIIGGGASGLGVAVDAASRGHSVALFEQSDFAKGTSSRSTKLVHGGVRYLQQGNISLVLEALRERGRLTVNAPHLVHPQSFVIPNYSWWEGPFYGIGMKVYDQMAGRLGLKPSKYLNREETIERIPTVETEHLNGGVVYYDGQFDDARLAINLAQTAEDHGAVMLNYLYCTGLIKDQDVVVGVEVHDELTGEDFAVKARCVINATGIFVDTLRQKDAPDAKPIIQVSQGIHFVLPKKFLPGDAAIMIPKTADGRVLFAVPWHGKVVVGTTDTAMDEPKLEPRALEEEKAFVLEHACKYLATDPGAGDILSVFAGLRPLVRKGDGADTSALSRDHTILISESGLITLTGGKWTTYRKMAEETMDQAETVGGLDTLPCVTKELRIHGWYKDGDHNDPMSVYGSDETHIRAFIREHSDLGTPIHPNLSITPAEVLWHVREEMAMTVEDVLARRTRSLLLDAQASIEAAPHVAELMATELQQDDDWIQDQIQRYCGLAKGYLY